MRVRRQQRRPRVRVAQPVAIRPAINSTPSEIFESCEQAIRRLLGRDPVSWDGTLYLHCCGKAGELVFLTGVLPALKRRLPKSKIVLRTMDHYRPSVEYSSFKFDGIEALPMVASSLVDSVTHHYMDRVYEGFLRVSNDLWVNVYRSHGWSKPRGFPSALAESVGIPADEYTRPGWDDGSVRGPRIALALATMNQHGSSRRRIPFLPQEWSRLSEELRRIGLVCVATGHADDGVPADMPGWKWVNCGLREALCLVRDSGFVIGGNSGLTFLGATIGAGYAIMLDEAAHGHLHLYDIERLGNAIDINRFHKIKTTVDGRSDRSAFDQTLTIVSKI